MLASQQNAGTDRGQICGIKGGVWLYVWASGKEAVVYGAGICPAAGVERDAEPGLVSFGGRAAPGHSQAD